MTVCIAAICEGATIIGASDRMVTTGSIKFEPQQTKIISISNSISIMIAGDIGLQTEILDQVTTEVSTRINDDPANWWRVADVADLYSHHYKEVKFKKAESAILAPLGMDGDTFKVLQQQMSPKLVKELAGDLRKFRLPVTQVIITGIDITGAHIFTIADGNISCKDFVGFASIGIGGWHADSQFMFDRHNKTKPMPETLLLVYSAKKRAEVAPGVGEDTDMFVIGPRLGTFIPIGQHVLTKLEQIYNKTQFAIENANQNAKETVTQYVEEITRAVSIPREQAINPDNSGRNESIDINEAYKIDETNKN